MYFQYDANNVPLGFIYNDTQYLYMTNLSGDVLGITEADGNFFAGYQYDEWGKLISIDTADEDGSTAYREIAEANPLRYRGCYYDSETGYYYLQSRYYDPEICRFINADTYEYIDNKEQFGYNLFAYCGNNPINFSDHTGHDFTWQTVFDIFKAIFLLDDASKLSNNFAYFMASIISSTTDFFKKFDWNWYVEIKENFKAFSNSVIGKLLDVFNKNFFVDLFEMTAAGTTDLFKSIGSTIKINFGYGNPNSFTNQIKELFGGSFPLVDSDKSSFGIIFNSEKWGVYFTGLKNSFGDIYSSMTVELTSKHINFDWLKLSPYPVLVEDNAPFVPSFDTGQYGPVIYTAAAIILLLLLGKYAPIIFV